MPRYLIYMPGSKYMKYTSLYLENRDTHTHQQPNLVAHICLQVHTLGGDCLDG